MTLALASQLGDAAKGSCRAARKCCDGSDGQCLINAFDHSSQALEPCYCDHGCIDMGDCCPDFKDYCGGEWCLITDPNIFSSFLL